MPDAVWWTFRSIEVATLMTCVVLTKGASRRVGPASAYGQILFLLALGFWLLLGGVLFVNVRALMLPAPPPGGLPDLVSLLGWGLIGTAFVLFALRFGRAETGFRRVGVAVASRVAVALALAAAAFLWLAGPDPFARPANPWRLLFLLVDAATLALAVSSIEGMVRLREGAIARLYALLAFALVLKTAGDVAYLWMDRYGGPRVVASAFYPLAGLVATAAVILHARLIARTPDATAWPDPSLRVGERALREALRRVELLAGETGRRHVLETASRVLRLYDARFSVSGDTLRADVSDEVWEEVARAVTTDVRTRFGDGVASALPALGRPVAQRAEGASG